MTILYILIPLIIVVAIGFFAFTIIKKNKTKQKIMNELNVIGPTRTVKNNIYDYEVDTPKCVYLVKVVYNYRNLEISVNSKNYWQLNDKIVSSKKGGAKIEGIYDLINSKEDLINRPYKKVYLIYPSAKVLVKALNESELTFIYPNTDCYGVHLVKFDEIKEMIKI